MIYDSRRSQIFDEVSKIVCSEASRTFNPLKVAMDATVIQPTMSKNIGNCRIGKRNRYSRLEKKKK